MTLVHARPNRSTGAPTARILPSRGVLRGVRVVNFINFA